MIGHKSPELLPKFRATAVINRVSRIPSMFRDSAGRGIIATMIEADIEGVEHAIICAGVGDHSSSFPSLDKLRIALVPIEDIEAFTGGAYDGRRGVHDIAESPHAQ